MVGVNLAGAEFGKVPGVVDRDYTYPGERHFAYLKGKGLLVVRLPFKWERIQREPLAPLDEAEMARLDGVVAHARKHGIKLLLDVHNYARYRGKLIGTTELPNEAFADLWRKLATRYRDEAAIFGYGLMNEPHDTGGLWPAAAQAGADAIRSVDRTHTILVCGDGWGGAHSWQAVNKDLAIRDPEGNLVYEAHQYFDRDSSGTYKESYDASGATPTVGVERLKPFADWLKARHARGFIGEFGVPDDDPRWLVVLDNFLAAMREHGIGGTYWAAGPWWGRYAQSVEPRDGRDRPQMAVLERYGVGGDPTGPKPWLAAAAEAERAAREGANRVPAGSRGGIVHDFAAKGESYHYSNEGSEFASETVEGGGRKARMITYKHKGAIAWVGVGVYFGGLGCAGHSGLALEIRSEKPCRLEVKAYHADGEAYSGVFPVGAEWQELAIPFARLLRNGAPYDPALSLRKIEFQPNPDPGGSSLLLGALRLVADR
ncbi:MAG TPA: glycoside hydrolase family 5 protein [Planctomycetota bacterium]|nr:glycoside hydrolase family 5 protein [Planctomycetota bacterium]HRR81979.1 glycoside hydrolase family 5 protein [Planctomycetota bacterium]